MNFNHLLSKIELRAASRVCTCGSAYWLPTSEGRANVRTGGRYHRVSVQPTGSWLTAMAIDVDFKPQGNR